MEEIATQFKEELQELLDRYKDKMSTPQIMHIAQPIFTKTIGFKDNPERLERILAEAVYSNYHAKFPGIRDTMKACKYALKGEPKCTD